MKALILVLSAVCFGASSVWAAIAAEPVSIQIEVINESGQRKPAVDAEVTLAVYQEGQLFERRKARTDGEGRCVFENVSTGRGRIAVAAASHQGMMFSSRVVPLEHVHEKVYQLPVSVYDVSTDTSVLSVGVHHFMMRPEPQGIFIDEYMQIINPSDKAVTSNEKTPDGKPAVLKIYLPSGFENVKCMQYFQERAMVRTKDGFIDTMAVPPGAHDAVFTYSLKPETSTFRVTKKVGLPTRKFMVFSRLNGAVIEGWDQPVRQMTASNGEQVSYLPPVALDAGSEVSFTVSESTAASDQGDLWVMFGIIFGVIVTVGAGRLLIQKRQSSI